LDLGVESEARGGGGEATAVTMSILSHPAVATRFRPGDDTRPNPTKSRIPLAMVRLVLACDIDGRRIGTIITRPPRRSSKVGFSKHSGFES